MGLQGANVSTATPKTPAKRTVGDCGQRLSPGSATSPKQTPHTPGRPERKSGRERRDETPKRNQSQGEGITPSPPLRSPATESDCFLGDFSRLSHWTTTSAPSRLPRTPRTSPPEQTRGRLGRVMRNFVKRMGGSSPWTRHASPSRSEISVESEWTFASASIR